MTEAPSSSSALLTVAEPAANYIKQLLQREGKPAGGMRIQVHGGGCSGLSYEFSVAEGASSGDTVIDAHGAKIFVDSQSAPYLKGTYVMFVKTLMKSSLKMMNPNAVAECSCGESFTV